MNEILKQARILPEGYCFNRFGEPEYTTWLEESLSWKENVYIGDWSFLAERWFKGPDALKLLSETSVNNVYKWDLYQSKHIIHCNSDGKIIAEEVASKLGEDEYMVFGRGAHLLNYYYNKHKDRFPNMKTWGDDWFNIMVQGPNSVALIEKLCGEDIRDIPFMHNRKIWINNKWMWALRQGMSGEPGFELQGPIQWREELIAELMEAGKEFNVHRMGGRIASINHLEACFPTIVLDYLPSMMTGEYEDYYHYFKAVMPPELTTFNIAGSYEAEDISEYYRSPVDFNWSNRINLDHDFIGKEALQKELENPKRVLRTLEWNSEDVIDVYRSLFEEGEIYDYIEFPRFPRGSMYVDKVMKDGKLVGVTSMYGYSYYFRKMICQCLIDIPESELGNEVTIIWGAPGHRQKEIRATVAQSPYKKDNRRVDLHTIQ